MKILIAPNAFKNALPALQAGMAVSRGLKQSNFDHESVVLPIADGGDGTLEILSSAFHANITFTKILGPLEGELEAFYGYSVNDQVGIVEIARTSGLQLLTREDLDPWKANTYGTGQIIKKLILDGCKEIYLTVGGSSSVDGGVGILAALGMKFYSGDQEITNPRPEDLKRIDKIDPEPLQMLTHQVKVILLSDVTNPLLGKDGAVRVFGKQKGVGDSEFEEFEGLMEHWATLVKDHAGKDITELVGGGASGGVPAGLAPFLNVEIREGAKEILKITGFHQELENADLVITTEGQIDGQTAQGKGPGLVAKFAREASIPCIGLCGQIGEDYDPNDSYFKSVMCINSRFDDLLNAMANTEQNLEFMSQQLGNLLAL